MFSNSSNPSPPLGKSLLGYQHGVPRISINNTGWARVFPSTPAHEMFSYWLRANLCRQLFSAINRFSRTDGIQQRYKHISRQDRRVCTQVVLCSLRLPADRAKSMESLSPLFSWQVFNFFCGWLFFFSTLFQPLFSFLISVTNCHPFREQHMKLAMRPAPLIAPPLCISAILVSVWGFVFF